MAVTESAEIKKISASGSNTEVNFEKQVKSVLIKTSGDVYVAFDREATTDDFLISSTDLITILPVKCTSVNLISSGTPTVYLIGVR